MSSEHLPDADALADHAAFVRAVARAALKGDDAVDDVVQETYVAALGSGPRKPGALRAWLAGIARRQAAARIRKLGIRRRGDPRAARPEAGDSTLDVAVRVETARQVVDAVMSLEEPYRSAVLLRYYDDLPPREIARQKHVPVETARTWVKRGLKQLRARLERDHGHGTERGGWRAVLLPLAALPEAGMATTATGVLGGVFVMKKVAALGSVLLLVTGGLLWWNHDDGAIEREETVVAPPEILEAAPAEIAAPAPTLAGRGEKEATELVAAAWADAPFRGRVLSPDGAALPDVRVTAPVWICRTADGRWSLYYVTRSPQDPLPTTTTDERGRFAFPATPDGAEEDPDRPCVAVDVHVIQVEGYLPAQARVERDKEAELHLVRGGALAVRVIDVHGAAIPEARVEVLPTTHTGPASLQGIPSHLQRLETGEDGRDETLLPAGRYKLRGSASGHVPGAVEDVIVEEGRRTEQVVRLGEGLEISVRVLGPEDEPVADASVLLAGPLRSTGQATTDAEGHCRIQGIAPLVEPDRYWESMVYYQVETKGYALRFGYRGIPRDEMTFELELRLVRGVPVRLHVIDDAGIPLENVEVSLTLDTNAANSLPSSITFTTDAAGWVELPRLGPRPCSVTLVNREGGYQTERIELVVGTEGIEREIVLERRRASLAGTVLLPDGSAATGGHVCVVPVEADRAHRLTRAGPDVAADGTFQLADLKGGRQVLVASVPGFPPQWQEIEVVPGQAREGVVFRLESRGRIRGRVLAWDDTPIADAAMHLVVLRIQEIAGRELHSMVQVPLGGTDADGHFELQGVDEEPLTLSVHREGWIRAWPWPEDVRAGTDDALFVMKPASEGSGMPLLARVTAGGQPYDGKLSVTVMDPGGGNPVGAIAPVSKGNGRYECRIHGRPPGRHDLRFTAPGWRPFEVRAFEVRHRPPRPEVVVTLDRGAVLELHVVDGDGQPWANRWLQYGMGQIRTDDRGIVELGGLEPGKLARLHVSDPTDLRYTYAYFESVPVPGALEVVMRRCGHVRVATPFLYSTVEHDLVFQALDAEGNVVDTRTHPAGRYGDVQRQAYGSLKVYADGTYRIVLETDGKRAETEVEARVGRKVEVDLDPR